MKKIYQTLGIACAALALSIPAQAAGGGSGGGGGGGSHGGGGGNSSRSEHSSSSHSGNKSESSKTENGKTIYGKSEYGSAETAKAEHGKAGSDKTTHAKNTTTTTTKTPSQQLASKPQLTDKLAKLLPPGTDMTLAADGFKNLGQFVAAVHVSKNLGIPFADLKTRMMDGASLGSAIKTLRPEVNAETEERKARKQAQTTQA